MFAYLPYLRTRLAALISDRKGVTTMEYAVIAATTVVATGLAMVTIGGDLGTIWTKIEGALTG